MRSIFALLSSVAVMAALAPLPALAEKDEPAPQAPAAVGQAVAEPAAPQPAPAPAGPIFAPLAQVIAAPSGPGCPGSVESAPNRDYSAEDLASIPTWTFTASGTTDLAGCTAGLRGFFSAEPTFSPVLTGMENRGLSLMLRGNCDTVLLVRDSDGQWHHADDTLSSTAAHLELWTGLEGRIDIWSGTGTGESCRPVIRAIALTPPAASATPQDVAAMIEGEWGYRFMGFTAALTLTQNAPDQWDGALRFSGQDTALTAIRVDGQTGRLEFISTGDNSFCYGILNGSNLDGACSQPDQDGLIAWEGYRRQ